MVVIGPGSRALRPLVGATLAALAVQFLVGMFVNLFVAIPGTHPGVGAAEYFSGVGQVIAWSLGAGALMLRLHVALGLLLFASGVAVLVLAIGARRRAWIWAAAIGLTGVMGAAFNGASFLNYNHDFSSYLMAASFLMAWIAYAAGMYVTR
jgi:hypothetical protein